MKILVPLNNDIYLEEMADSGAEEFYCGFYDPEWEERFGKFASLNRMSGFGKRANRYSFSQVLKIADKVHDLGCSFFITMNAEIYTQEELGFIREKYIPRLLESRVNGVIVSGKEIGCLVSASGLQVIGSTMMSVYNADIARFYYNCGIKRIILPRDLSLAEIESIIQSCPDDVTFEVFFMRNGCVFSDGYCLGTHRPECGATCSWLKHQPKAIRTCTDDFKILHDLHNTRDSFESEFHKHACGQCAMYRLDKMGVHSLKLVGRADDVESMIKDIKLTQENMNILKECDTEEAYLKRMKMPDNRYLFCRNGMSCYYPEVQFG